MFDWQSVFFGNEKSGELNEKIIQILYDCVFHYFKYNSKSGFVDYAKQHYEDMESGGDDVVMEVNENAKQDKESDEIGVEAGPDQQSSTDQTEPEEISLDDEVGKDIDIGEEDHFWFDEPDEKNEDRNHKFIKNDECEEFKKNLSSTLKKIFELAFEKGLSNEEIYKKLQGGKIESMKRFSVTDIGNARKRMLDKIRRILNECNDKSE